MKPQPYEEVNQRIRQQFEAWKAAQTAPIPRLRFSWSIWAFGQEGLAASCARLRRNGIEYVELCGNHHTALSGETPATVRHILQEEGLEVSGACGIFSPDIDLSSNRVLQRQAAQDYILREAEFLQEVGGRYLLLVPGAVGRPEPYDDAEEQRSVDSLRRVADVFLRTGVKGAIEPIRAEEVSLVHTLDEAEQYLQRLDHPGVAWINGDVYHMQTGERHIGAAILAHGERLLNLHVADSHRGALGEGMLDLDTVIRALYLIGQNREGRFVTAEPLGPGCNPYAAMNGRPAPGLLDQLVAQTVGAFREREELLLQ